MVRHRLVIALGGALLWVGFLATAANGQFFRNRELVADGVRWSPSLTPDGLELYYTNYVANTWDVWRMTRDSVDGEWLTDDFVDELDSARAEDGFTFSADGLSVVFGSLRDDTWDLWQSQRSDRTATWDEPIPLEGVNTVGPEGTPSLSPDGLTLFFSSLCCSLAPRPGATSHDIWYSTRPSTQSNEWSEPQIHPVSSAQASDSNPSISPDGLSLYFVSTRIGGYGDFDVYVATRTSLDEEFGEPLNLGPLVNGTLMDYSPHIGSDGLLYYTPDSVFGDVNTGWDIWSMAPFTPRPGDFNGDEQLSVEDIDLFVQRARLFAPERTRVRTVGFDLNEDGVQDRGDLNYWVRELKQTWLGDANLDGEFNSSDLTLVFQAGGYEDNRRRNSSWATGDWDGDLDFTTSDLVVAFQDGGYERGARAGVNAVPEPSSSLWLVAVLGATSIGYVRRRMPI